MRLAGDLLTALVVAVVVGLVRYGELRGHQQARRTAFTR